MASLANWSVLKCIRISPEFQIFQRARYYSTRHSSNNSGHDPKDGSAQLQFQSQLPRDFLHYTARVHTEFAALQTAIIAWKVISRCEGGHAVRTQRVL